ncbi:MAG: HDOD domain-containing protein [Candidatus Hydrogenedentes bacterium]|nr:HDOD domain-containing protein [Candidatus Hydrogenedentota bacterium]
MAKRRIGELLVDAGLIHREQLQEGLNTQAAKGGKIVETLIALGYLDAEAFVGFLARQPGVASIDLSKYEIPRQLIELIPREMAVEHEIFPIDKLGRLLTVGMVCPLDSATVQKIEERTGLRVKPLLCAPSDIRSAIERYYPEPAPGQEAPPVTPTGVEVPDATGIRASIRLTNVANLIRQIDTLPALPETVRRVQEATLDPLSSVRDVADIIVLDPPIAAKVLSVANSAAYGFPQRVDDVGLAVSLLGLRETYAIVLSAAVVNVFDKSKVFDYRAFWVESMCCAAATRIIAKASGRKRQIGVFSGGLLHDIGRLALSEVASDLYGKVDQGLDGEELIANEEEILGLSHTEAGHLLAAHWGLPIEIAEPIRFHHRPELAVDAKENVAIVAIANLMARALQTKLEDSGPLLEAITPSLAVLGLDRESAEAMLDEYLNMREDCLRDSLI